MFIAQLFPWVDVGNVAEGWLNSPKNPAILSGPEYLITQKKQNHPLRHPEQQACGKNGPRLQSCQSGQKIQRHQPFHGSVNNRQICGTAPENVNDLGHRYFFLIGDIPVSGARKYTRTAVAAEQRPYCLDYFSGRAIFFSKKVKILMR